MTSNPITPEMVIAETIDGFTKDLGESQKDKLYLELLMSGDSSIITGMSRNIGWSSNPRYNKSNFDDGEAFDVIFGFTLVVREHPVLMKQLWIHKPEDTPQSGMTMMEKYYERLYGAATNLIKVWRDIAVQVWLGTYDASKVAPIPDYYKFPKGGEPAITIFGNVITPDGTASSLTLNEHANPAFALMRMKYQVKTWMSVGNMGHGVHFNPFGEQPYKEKDTYIPAEKKKRTSKKSLPKQPPKKKEGSETVTQAQYWADLANMDARSMFNFRVARVRFYLNKGVESLMFYGYRISETGQDIVETNDNIWTSRSDKGGTDAVQKFDRLKQQLSDAGFLPEVDQNIDVNGELHISGMKLVGKAPNYTAYYRDLAVV